MSLLKNLNPPYQIIYMDPPWPEDGAPKKFLAAAENHFVTMPMERIASLRVSDLAADNAVLFCWFTGRHILRDSGGILERWGFRPVNVAFTWVKRTKHWKLAFGPGNYTHSNAEFCVIGIKGRAIIPIDRAVSSLIYECDVVEAQQGRLAEKPEEVRRRIERMYPTHSRLELFARKGSPGWDSTGLDYDGVDILELIGPGGDAAERGAAVRGFNGGSLTELDDLI